MFEDLDYSIFLAASAICCETNPERKEKAKKVKALLIKLRDVRDEVIKLLDELSKED